MMIKWIGYWGTYDSNESPPYYVLDNKSGYDKLKVVEYLKGGHRILAFKQYKHCIFGCGASGSDLSGWELTDGEWRWSEELVHYVDHHYIDLPDEFILHMEKQGFVVNIPHALKNELEKEQKALFQGLTNIKYSTEFWLAWLREKESTVDENRLVELKESIKPFVGHSPANDIPDSWPFELD